MVSSYIRSCALSHMGSSYFSIYNARQPSSLVTPNPFLKFRLHEIRLTVAGKPVAKQRHGFNSKTGRAYPKKETTTFENDVRSVWRENGEPRIEGPVTIKVIVVLERPSNHFRKGGQLSAAGERLPFPTKRPDADNVFKSVTDALNSRAYKDDSQIVDAVIRKRWGPRQETIIVIREQAEKVDGQE